MLINKCGVGLLAFGIGAALTAVTQAAQPQTDTPGSPVTKHAVLTPLRATNQPAAAIAPRRMTIENPRVQHLYYGPQGSVAGVPPGVTVYRNDIDLQGFFLFYAPNDTRTLTIRTMADDLVLPQGGCDRMAWYEIAVMGEATSGIPTFNMHAELRTGSTCDPTARPIAGTQMDFNGLPNDGTTVSFLSMPIPLTPPVLLPETVWLWMTVTAPGGGFIPDAGWILAERAEVGFTDDKFSQGSAAPCEFFFPPSPDQPAIYAGFWAVVNCDLGGDPMGACCNGVTCSQLTEIACGTAGGTWQGAFTSCDPSPCLNGACCTGGDFATCNETTEAACTAPDRLFHPLGTCADNLCKPAFPAYVNDFNTGFFATMPLGGQWADDLGFVPCDESLAVSLNVVGTDGTPAFDVRMQLWTNDDRQTPDPTDDIPLAPIDGTFSRFTNIRANFIPQTLLAGPFPKLPLDGNVWLVFSTSSADSGPSLAGMPDPGSSRDAFAVIDDPMVPTSAGAWVGNVGFPGNFDPTTCPGGATCNPADSFTIKVWCQGDPPNGTCCNDAAGTVVTGVQEAFCDGRWIVDLPGTTATFDPPCGTGACCTQFACTDLLADECAALSQQQGVPVSFRAGSLCGVLPCPRVECLGATGDCFSSQLTPSCDDAYCCDTVCNLPNNSTCCSGQLGLPQWDRICAADAAAMCEPVLANDHCSNAEPITGVGDFAFDTTLATTDGAPHTGCLDSSGKDHIINDQWFCWTSTCPGNATVTTCGFPNAVDTKLAVYDGCGTCPPTDSALAACNDDACSATPTQSTVVFSAGVGEQKMIRLGMFPDVNAARGAGQFRILCGAPPNPACPGIGDCCADNGSPGCTDRACCEQVCACDPSCCDGTGTWDAACAGTGRLGTGCGAAVLCGACRRSGDLDGNGFIDGSDWQLLANSCLLGPGVAWTSPLCEPADFDGDGFINMTDVNGFMQVFNTPAP